MELCVRRSKNISELNGWGVLRYWRSKWIQNGSPTAATPARNQGARKPTTSSPSEPENILAARHPGADRFVTDNNRFPPLAPFSSELQCAHRPWGHILHARIPVKPPSHPSFPCPPATRALSSSGEFPVDRGC